LAGQWVDVFIPGLETVGGFSIANAPSTAISQDTIMNSGDIENGALIQLAVKEARHPPAKWMHTECAVGSTVIVRAGGSVVLRLSEPSRPALFIAGGIGIVPLHSMLAERTAVSTRLPTPSTTRLMYSIRHPDDMLFGKSLSSLKKKCPGVDGTVFLTGTTPLSELPQSHRGPDLHSFPVLSGRITPAALNAQLRELGEPDVYICGQQDMCDELEIMLLELGCPRHRIIYERWW
jgi:ferredoxin-NADP reductase